MLLWFRLGGLSEQRKRHSRLDVVVDWLLAKRVSIRFCDGPFMYRCRNARASNVRRLEP